MSVPLRDRLFSDTGTIISGATVQAYLVTGGGTDAGTASALAATTSTDVNGVWKFTALADPGAGNWYDVKITNGTQVRWRYGNIQAFIQALQFAQSLTIAGGQTLDVSAATAVLKIPVAAGLAPTAAGSIGLNSTINQMVYGDGAVTHTLVDTVSAQTVSGAKTFTSPVLNTPTSNNGTFNTPAITDPAISTFSAYKGTVTQVMPTSVGNSGKARFYKAWGGSLVVQANPTEFIIGPGTGASTGLQTSFTFQDGESGTFYCDGTEWWAL